MSRLVFLNFLKNTSFVSLYCGVVSYKIFNPLQSRNCYYAWTFGKCHA